MDNLRDLLGIYKIYSILNVLVREFWVCVWKSECIKCVLWLFGYTKGIKNKMIAEGVKSPVD